MLLCSVKGRLLTLYCVWPQMVLICRLFCLCCFLILSFGLRIDFADKLIFSPQIYVTDPTAKEQSVISNQSYSMIYTFHLMTCPFMMAWTYVQFASMEIPSLSLWESWEFPVCLFPLQLPTLLKPDRSNVEMLSPPHPPPSQQCCCCCCSSSWLLV